MHISKKNVFFFLIAILFNWVSLNAMNVQPQAKTPAPKKGFPKKTPKKTVTKKAALKSFSPKKPFLRSIPPGQTMFPPITSLAERINRLKQYTNDTIQALHLQYPALLQDSEKIQLQNFNFLLNDLLERIIKEKQHPSLKKQEDPDLAEAIARSLQEQKQQPPLGPTLLVKTPSEKPSQEPEATTTSSDTSTSTAISSIQIPSRGFKNWSGTHCYMNAPLQCLFHCPLFIEYLQKSKTTGAWHTDLKKLLTAMTQATTPAISPETFERKATSLYFSEQNNFHQQDASEFIIKLLNNLHNEEIAMDLFDIPILSTIECAECKTITKDATNERILSAEIPSAMKDIAINDCTTAYLSQETLTGADAYNCPQCKKLVDASKQLSIGMAPQILIVHLKRFSKKATASSVEITKNDTPVRIAVTIEVPHTENTATYQLKGVCLHNGSFKSGHYTSLVQEIKNEWKFYNDSSISDGSKLLIELEKAGSTGYGTPYLLYYERSL